MKIQEDMKVILRGGGGSVKIQENMKVILRGGRWLCEDTVGHESDIERGAL